MAHEDPPGRQVVVAVATYRRPALLERLLPALLQQARAHWNPTRVLVVDNDPLESARGVVQAMGADIVRYTPEPRAGIAAARNRALEEAGDAAALIFVDDDEQPGAGWLDAIVGAWEEWRCTAVAGPVISDFEGPVTAWVRASPVFDRRRLPSGTRVGSSASNNLLLDVAQVRRLALRFDDRFGLTGGEDTMLTRSIVHRGGQIRWCDEAIMRETVPTSRANRRWALRRIVRTGNVWARVTFALTETPAERTRAALVLLSRATYRVLRGTSQALLGALIRDVERRVRGESDLATALGVLLGLGGHVVVEYKRVPT